MGFVGTEQTNEALQTSTDVNTVATETNNTLETMNHPSQQRPMRELIQESLQHYFEQLDGLDPENFYRKALAEFEIPLLKVVMQHVRGNQCHASRLLKISRGNLRQKLAKYKDEL